MFITNLVSLIKLRTLKFVLALAMLLVFAAYILQALIPENKLRPTIQALLKEKIGHDIQINGHVSLNLLPLPTIKASNLFITINNDEYVRIGALEVRPSLLAIFGSKGVSSIKLSAMDANFDFSNTKFYDSLNFFKNEDISTVEVVDSSINYKSYDGKKYKLENLGLTFGATGWASKKFTISSNFSIDLDTKTLLIKFDDSLLTHSQGQVDVNLLLKDYKIDYSGNVDLRNHETPKCEGNLSIAPILDQTDPNTGELSFSGLFFKILKAQVSGKLIFDGDKADLTEIKIASPSIGDASGSFSANLKDGFTFDSTINIKSLDFNKSAIANDFPIQKQIEALIKTFDYSIPKFVNGKININIDQLNLNRLLAKNFKFSSSIDEGILTLDAFKAAVGDDGDFNITGVISSNDIRPKFSGTILLNLPELSNLLSNLDQTDPLGRFVLHSNFTFIPRSLRLENIRAILDEKKIKGNILIRDLSEKTITAKINLAFSELDLDKLGITAQFNNLVTNLYTYDIDKSSASFFNYVNHFQYLRQLDYNLTADISADTVIYKKQPLHKLLTNFSIARNKFSFNHLSVASDRLAFDGNFLLNVFDVIPQIDLAVNFHKADMEILSFLIPSFKNLAITQKNNVILLNKTGTLSKLGVDIDANNLSDLNFFSMHNFDGNLKISADSLLFENIPLSKIKLDAQLASGSLLVKDLSANMLNGRGQLVGTLYMANTSPSLNFSFTLNNFNPHDLLWYVYNNNSLSGFMSLTGTLQSGGYDTKTLFNNLNSNINLLGRDFSVNGIDVDDYITSIDTMITNKNGNLANAAKTINTGQMVFDEIKGTATFAKGIWSSNDITAKSKRITSGISASFVPQDTNFQASAIFTFIPLSGLNNNLNIKSLSKGLLGDIQTTFDLKEVENYASARIPITKTQDAKPFSTIRDFE